MSECFQIQAEFPLGVYYGGDSSGERESLPDMARVFSALVHSAYRSTGAQNGELDDPYREALAWLEQNPPTALILPEFTMTQRPSAAPIAYNSEGYSEKDSIKVAGKPAGVGTAVAGPVGWLWEDDLPSDAVETALVELCSEVAYLGESTSLVYLRCGIESRDLVRPTHQLGDAPFLPASTGSTSCEVPSEGRLHELDQSYGKILEAKTPSKAADKPAKSESLRIDEVSRVCVEPLWYEPIHVIRSLETKDQTTPWVSGLFWPAGPAPQRIRPVQACAMLHKALCRQLDGFNIPTVTGNYEGTMGRPANRLALHYLDERTASLAGLEGQGFLLAFPFDIDPSELDVIFEAAHRVTFVPAGGRVDLDVPLQLDLTQFWPKPASGTQRIWYSANGVVPESRSRQRGVQQLLTLEDAACLSVSYVYRDAVDADPNLGRPGRIAAAKDCGVEVFDTKPIVPFKVKDYVHKVPKTLGIHPFDLDLYLGDLHADQAFLALGQSRHLGGGLMVPLDISIDTLDVWRNRRA